MIIFTIICINNWHISIKIQFIIADNKNILPYFKQEITSENTKETVQNVIFFIRQYTNNSSIFFLDLMDKNLPLSPNYPFFYKL